MRTHFLPRYTTAPLAYDGFGTQAVAIVGTYCGQPLRLVRVRAEHLEWQDGRYGSGMHGPWTSEAFAQQIVPSRDFTPAGPEYTQDSYRNYR